MERKKYPRTYHLPFSLGLQSDDKKIETLDFFKDQEVVVSLKMDGENTSVYPDGFSHARSLDSKFNWTQSIVRQIASTICYQIPEGHRLCCENLTAKHSIFYPDGYLEGYLYLLSIWKGDTCLDWDSTVKLANELDLPMPKVLYRGSFDLKKLEELSKQLDVSIEEGFVTRVTRSFKYEEFSKCVTKFVRKGHVQDNADHWLKNAVPNGQPMQPCKPAFLSKNIKKIKM